MPALLPSPTAQQAPPQDTYIPPEQTLQPVAVEPAPFDPTPTGAPAGSPPVNDNGDIPLNGGASGPPVDSGGDIPLSAPPQQAAPQQPQQPQQPPADTGSALDAVGATVAQITPSNIVRKAGEIKDAAPGALSEFTGVGRDASRAYRPAPPGVAGESEAAAGARTQEAVQGLRSAAGQGVGNTGNILGAGKDVALAAVAQNKGEISPERANQIRWQTERLNDQITTGDPFASKPNADPLERTLWDTYWSKGAYADWARANPEEFQRALTEGYTTPDNFVWAPGLDAPWELFQSGRSGLERGLSDISAAPLGTLADLATAGVGLAGEQLLTTGTEQAARIAGKGATKQLVGKGLIGASRAADAAATFGLSEAVPATFNLAGKAYRTLPWVGKLGTEAANRQAAQTLEENATQALAGRRLGEGQPGVPGVEAPSQILTPTADPAVKRVAIPADAAGPALDVTYHVNTNGVLDGVYDVAVPGPLDRYRPLTEADAQHLYDAWARLGPADRQTLRQSAYPPMSRLETSPGEPFIEPGAERVFDRHGNLVADTGRVGTGYAREREDLRRTMLRDGRPDQIVTDFTGSWLNTLFDGKVHPLTRRSLAEHRLQTLRDTLDSLPASYRTPEIERHYRQMRDLLPPDAPNTIGTGLKWRGPVSRPGGGLVPASPRERSWLREMAALPPDAFDRKTLDAGRVRDGGINLVFDRKPPPTAPAAYRNGYTTYLDLMDYRVKNPATGRKEIASLKTEVNGLRTAAPTPAAQSREDAIKEVLERTGIVPNATTLNTDDLVIAIENHLRTTRPTFPPLPGANPTPPAGIYPAGSEHERWGMWLATDLHDSLAHQVEIGGVSRTAGERLMTHWQETAKAYEAAKRVARGIPLDPADERLLDTQVKKIATRFPGEYKRLTASQLAGMKPEEIDRIAAGLARSDLEISQGVRGATGKMLTPAERKGLAGKALALYDGFLSLWRSTVLYNIGRGAQYISMQALGNLFTAAHVIRSRPNLIPYYLNPREWYRGLKYLRDPEVETPPAIIQHLDRVGLGRLHTLGRVSRDQIGARSFYNKEDSHAVTKAVGKILGNQDIKDAADSFDLRLRQGTFESVWEPGYARLKRDLPEMADTRFREYAARAGVPLTLTRDQVDNALSDLERRTGGYFSQPELRDALYQAAGGSAAPNRKTVFDAADRTARDYQHELRQLAETASAETDRIAFGGGDTNLEQVFNRFFVFTWWVSRASRLYAIETARSPIMMGMWARALHAGEQRQATGTHERYKEFMGLMQTPAGWTMSLNPFSLMGGWLLGTTADPDDPRANLTAVGKFFSGGWVGSNLVLNPVLGAALTLMGAMGQDYRMPDLFGTNRLEQEIVNALNYANYHWVQFNKTKGGNPERVPLAGFSPSMVNWLAQKISGQIAGTQQVAGYDANAPAEAQIASLIAEQVQRDNPELDPNDPLQADTLRRGVDAAMADHDSPQYQEALKRWVDGIYLTGGSWRDTVTGLASHFALPMSVSRQPTFRADANLRKGRDALREDGATNLTPDMEATKFDRTLGYVGARSPQGRDLALIEDAAAGDARTQRMRDLYNGIRYSGSGDLTATMQEVGISGLDVDGYHFTAAQIASLPADDRRALAERWIDAAGLRPTMEQYFTNRTAQLRGDKAYADAEGWDDYAKQYPGGIERAADDTAQINPNYARFLAGDIVRQGHRIHLPDLRVSDPAGWAQVVTSSPEAKHAIAGVKDSRYGLNLDPKYAGVVAGLNEPVGAWYLKDSEDKAAGSESDFTKGLRDDYAQYTKIAAGMDKLDQQWGRPVGTTRAIFVQNTLNGALDSSSDRAYALPKAEHDALKAMGLSDYMPETTRLKSYFEWAVQQTAGADTSIDAYNQAYFAGKNKDAVPDIALRLATGQVGPVNPETGEAVAADPLSNLVMTDAGVGVGVRPGPATLGRSTILASEPGGSAGPQVPAGMPVVTGQKMQGSDGSIWVYVSSGPVGGWINVADLAAA